MSEKKKKPLGEILKEENIVKEETLKEALAEQKSSGKKLGNILVDKGFASMKDIIYALALQAKGKTPAQIATTLPLSIIDRIKRKRIPIRVKLSILITAIIVVIMFLSSYLILSRQREQFTKQMIIFGTTIVGNLSNNSSISLLEDDEASLNILIEQVSKNKEIVYAMVIDKKGVIKVHTDISKVDKKYEPLKDTIEVKKDESIEISKYREEEREILNFSIPVKYQKVAIGTIHMGLSLETLENNISEAKFFVIVLTILLILIGIGISLFMSTLFSKPVYNLVDGTREIKNGNFNYRIDLFSNDELGDLTLAFNDMADGLRKKEVIQESFGRYVTPEIVDMILQNPDEKWLKGKKLNVTVMFADIRGFTSFSEKKEPDEVVNILNEYFSMATEVIQKHGGHIDKFAGDEIMVVFGAPIAYEDHSVRAVRAAVSLQNELKNFNSRKAGEGREAIRIGTGINSGDVVAGNLGSSKKMEYTVIGDNVNLASRLTREAKADDIIISDSVYEKVADIANVDKLEPVMVKGKSKPIQIYRVKELKSQGV